MNICSKLHDNPVVEKCHLTINLMVALDGKSEIANVIRKH